MIRASNRINYYSWLYVLKSMKKINSERKLKKIFIRYHLMWLLSSILLELIEKELSICCYLSGNDFRITKSRKLYYQEECPLRKAGQITVRWKQNCQRLAVSGDSVPWNCFAAVYSYIFSSYSNGPVWVYTLWYHYPYTHFSHNSTNTIFF